MRCPLAVHALHGLFFLQNFRKSHRQRPTSRGCEKIRQKFAPNGKSGILYTRDEEETSSSIHKTDLPSRSFLSLF